MDSLNNNSGLNSPMHEAVLASDASTASCDDNREGTPSDTQTQLYADGAFIGPANAVVPDDDIAAAVIEILELGDDNLLGDQFDAEQGGPVVLQPVVVQPIAQVYQAVAKIVPDVNLVTNVVLNMNKGAQMVSKKEKRSQAAEANERKGRLVEFKSTRALHMHDAKTLREDEKATAEKKVKSKTRSDQKAVAALKADLVEQIAVLTKVWSNANTAMLARIEEENTAEKQTATALLNSQVKLAQSKLAKLEEAFIQQERDFAAQSIPNVPRKRKRDDDEDEDEDVSEVPVTPARVRVIRPAAMMKRTKTFSAGADARLSSMLGKLNPADAAVVLKDVNSTVARVETELSNSADMSSPAITKKSRKTKADKSPDTPEQAAKKKARNLKDADRRMKKKEAAQLESDFIPADLSSFSAKKPKTATTAQVSDSEEEVQEKVAEKDTKSKKPKKSAPVVVERVSESEPEEVQEVVVAVVERNTKGMKSVRAAPPVRDPSPSESSSSEEE